MILENRSEIEESDEEDGYIKENEPEDPENETPIMLGTPNIPIEDDDSNSGKSISLFD